MTPNTVYWRKLLTDPSSFPDESRYALRNRSVCSGPGRRHVLVVATVAVGAAGDRWVVEALEVPVDHLADQVAVADRLGRRVVGGDDVVPVEGGDLRQRLQQRAPARVGARGLQSLDE